MTKSHHSHEEFIKQMLAELDYLAAPKAKVRLEELLEALDLANSPTETIRKELHKHLAAWEGEVARFLRKNPKYCWNDAVDELRSRGGKWKRLYSNWERSLQVKKLWKDVT